MLYYIVLFTVAFFASLSVLFDQVDKRCNVDSLFNDRRKIYILFSTSGALSVLFAMMYCYFIWYL